MQHIKALIDKYNKPIPRYTSFPPVPYWHDAPTEHSWIEGVLSTYSSSDGVDIYIHVPFCEQLCYYCGCNRVITRNHDNEDVFINYLLKEWKIYQKAFGDRAININSIHFGGGTPNFLSARNLTKVIEVICANKAKNFFGSIEVDPRTVSFEQLDTLTNLGITRFSFGIQDFDPIVQKSINRAQSVDMIRSIVDYLRKKSVESINFDLIYGLPNQSIDTITRTFSHVVDLAPDMIAFYSYAHLPDKLKNQKLIKAKELPSAGLKRQLYDAGKELLQNNGFIEIGMDHFAKEDNFLVKCLQSKKLKRSFMGYTDKRSNILLALGPTAISESDLGFIQNEKNLKEYMEKLDSSVLPMSSGSTNSENDKLVALAIQEIMCQFVIRKDLLKKLPLNNNFDFAEFIADGLLIEDNEQFIVTELGRAFVRNLANLFDFYDHEKSRTVKFSQSI